MLSSWSTCRGFVSRRTRFARKWISLNCMFASFENPNAQFWNAFELIEWLRHNNCVQYMFKSKLTLRNVHVQIIPGIARWVDSCKHMCYSENIPCATGKHAAVYWNYWVRFKMYHSDSSLNVWYWHQPPPPEDHQFALRNYDPMCIVRWHAKFGINSKFSKV